MGHYLDLLEEIPPESPRGWSAGAVGKAAIRSLIEGDLWYTYAKASPGSVGGIATAGGLHGGSTKENQGFLIDVAKAIQGDLIITKTSDLQEEWDMFMAGAQTFKEFYRNTNISTDALDSASSLDDSDKIRRNNPDTGAADFLAYNLLNSSTFGSIISAAKLAHKLGYFTLGGGISEVFARTTAGAAAVLEYAGLKDEQDLQALEERFRQAQQGAAEAKAASEEDIEKTEQDVKIHMQALLASNLVELAKFNKDSRSLMMPRYSKTYLLDGPPSELVNKLTYVPGSESFINLTVPEASSLVPMIKLWKVRYNSKGSLDPDLPAIPLIFKTFTDTDSDFISGHGAGRSGVGIKSFDWQYNGTNPATVKNDITAKLVLYFQNFNDLLKEQENGFKYVDLLIRSSPTSTKDKEKSIEGQNETDIPENKSTTEGDSKHYEIKATVGWSPNVQYIEEHGNPDLATGIRNQQVSLFLTLVEHEFKITQQGTFELTIDYRGRIDGIMMDKRADVILDGEVRKQMSKLAKDLEEANSNCFKDEVKDIKEKMEDVKTRAKFESHTKVFQDLLGAGRLYYAKISKDDWDAAGQKIINLKKVDIGIPVDGSPIKTLYKASDDILNKEMQIAFGERPDVIEGGCGTSYQSTAAFAAWYLGNVTAGMHADNNLTWWNPLAQASAYLLRSAGAIDEEPAAWEPSQEDSDWWKCFKLQYNTTTGQEQPEEKPLAIATVEFENGQLGEKYGLREEDGSQIIPYFFLGDLIDIAARKALGNENSTPDESEDAADFNPNRVQNLGIILGCLEIAPQGKQENWEYINIGDIPVCLPYFRDWWARHTTKSSKNSYPLIKFIRDCLKDFAMEALGDDLFDGQRSQKLMIRDASISVPARPGGGNPIEDRINKGLDNVNERGLLKASRLDLNKIDNTSPMQAVNPTNLTPNDMYFYKVFYLVNDSPDYLNGNKQEDSKKGIQHIVMGSRSGLLKEANFSRSTSPGLREQRVIEESEFNPLSHLADVYNISARMIGNTMFFPGQYIYLNPIGFGTKLGNPADPGSPSRAMGLGGYHLVTQVSSFIDQGKFETTVEALWETSGGPGARRNDRGQKTEKGDCSSDASNTALSSPTPSPESNIELPE